MHWPEGPTSNPGFEQLDLCSLGFIQPVNHRKLRIFTAIEHPRTLYHESANFKGCFPDKLGGLPKRGALFGSFGAVSVELLQAVTALRDLGTDP